MPRINIPPTRSNLIRIRKDLQFAREGYEILDRKREVLTTELIRLAHEAGELQEQMHALLAEAYRALEKAQLTMGREHVEWRLWRRTRRWTCSSSCGESWGCRSQ